MTGARIGRYIKVKGGFWWCSLMLAVILAVPCVGGPDNILNGVYNSVCILVLFPLIVSIGAGSEVRGSKNYALPADVRADELGVVTSGCPSFRAHHGFGRHHSLVHFHRMGMSEALRSACQGMVAGKMA